MQNSKGLAPLNKHHNYVLGSENTEDNFDALLHLVKEFIVAVWNVRRQNYTVMTHTQVNFSVSPQPKIGVLLLELGVGLVSQVSLVSHMVRVRVHAGVNCVCNVCSSAHSCGCMVNRSFARAAL